MTSLRGQTLPFYRSCLRIATPPIQSFSTSPARRRVGNALPTFQPTSSPDLDALLTTWRTNIFLPAHLPPAQRNLIYRKKHHHLLTADEPATASIGEEIVQLRPLDRTKDEPSTRSTIAKMMNLMAQAGDGAWDNFPGFLMGLKRAKRKLKGWQVEKIVRRACTAGKEGLILQCVYMVERTGLGLWELGVVREMMWAAVRRAGESGWSKKGVERGLKLAEGIWVLMQDPRHVAHKKSGLVDPMSRPEVVGVLVELHAAQAVMFDQVVTAETKEKVARYVKILLALWPKDSSELAISTPENGKETWHEANEKAMMWAPVAHGVKLARQVLGEESEMGRELGKKLENELEPLLRDASEIILRMTEDGKSKRGMQALKLVGLEQR